MGLNTLNNRSAGQTIVEGFFNELNQALNTDFVGRNVTGVPTAGQNLGTVAIPWGTGRFNQLIVGGAAIDPSQITAPQNRVKSGKTRTSSNQPQFITPNGAVLTLVIDATPTPLSLDVNGTDVEVASDITITGLTAAPSSQNTALVNDVDAADQHDTRLWGEPEHRKKITIDTVGTNITALVGKYAAFMISNGSDTEYFLAYVESATVLSQIRRGYFYDSTLAPKNRIVFSNNDTITLLKMGFIFVENDGTTADVTYTNPVWSFTAPGGPATGDYWYDLQNQMWKRYDGATFQIINRTIVGVFANSTAACVGARCIDFFAKYTTENTLSLAKFSTEIVKGSKPGQKVNVAGMEFDFAGSLASWNITTDLAATADMYDATEQASRMYYLYVTDLGDTVISDISPYFRDDLFGEYHPHNPWRCVGLAYNDGSNDLQGTLSVSKPGDEHFSVNTGNGAGAVEVGRARFSVIDENTSASPLYVDDSDRGAYGLVFWPGGYEFSSSFISNGNRQYSMSKNLTEFISKGGAAASGDYTGTTGSISGKIGDTVEIFGENGGFTNATDQVSFRGRRTA